MKKITAAALAALFALTTACSTPESSWASQDILRCPEDPSASEIDALVSTVDAELSGNQTVKNVQEYLDGYNIDYSDVDFKDGVLTVSLNSQGLGYCTIEDVQAMQYVDEAVHIAGVLREVDGVQLYLYDAAGKQIGNSYGAIVKHKNIAWNKSDDNTDAVQSAGIISTMESIVAEHCNAEISQIEMQDKTDYYGSCLTMVLVEDDVRDITMYGLDILYMALEEYSVTGRIGTCSITVKDTAGESMLYMGGDFVFGGYTIWVNPDYKDVLIDVGPAPVPDEDSVEEAAAGNYK